VLRTRAGIVDRDHAGMAHGAEDLRLTDQPRVRFVHLERGADQRLHRYACPGNEVLALEHCTLAAARDLAPQRVATIEHIPDLRFLEPPRHPGTVAKTRLAP